MKITNETSIAHVKAAQAALNQPAHYDADVQVAQKHLACASGHREIHALVKAEGSEWTVRLYDAHGIELCIWLYSARYAENSESAQAHAGAWAVAKFINSLCPAARNAMYEAQRK